MSIDDTNAARRGSGSNDLLGQALEDAAYDCMSELAGADTHDVNLRDHPQAWAAIEAFAAKVKAAERERRDVLTDDMLRYAMAAMGAGSPKEADNLRTFWRFAIEARNTKA